MIEDLGDEVGEVLDFDLEEFESRVWEDTEFIKHELSKGSFDNPQAITGLEYEFYAVTDRDLGNLPDSYLARVPRPLLRLIGFEKELGLHNAEMSTSPQPVNEYGLAAQENEVKSRLKVALETAEVENLRLVSDGMWTVPPAGENSRDYLTNSVRRNGMYFSPNISPSTRYHVMSNGVRRSGNTIRLDAPNVSLDSETIAPASLTTSIQPHYQVPEALDLPEYFSYAIRIAGPLLALGVNSPFFPPDLYDDVDPLRIIEEGWADHRIRVFESVMNVGSKKVTFPQEYRTTEEAVDSIAEDDVYVPIKLERGNSFSDNFAYFNLKRGTYWRWVRPVFEGNTETDAHLRIEFRPISGQPTVRDTIGFQALYVGLLTALPRHEHPVLNLDWETARDNFYRAAKNGLDARIEWINSDGERTTDMKDMYDEIFEFGLHGLEYHGFDGGTAYDYLWPLKKRFEEDITPASWKRRRVLQRLSGESDFRNAVESMQREYIRKQDETLLDGTFVDWIRASTAL
ncbi:MAG: hypothetical protein SV377_01750 [Halobacteria archaeon]|nr:hypothetical protein [Halobacteria archaeon]